MFRLQGWCVAVKLKWRKWLGACGLGLEAS